MRGRCGCARYACALRVDHTLKSNQPNQFVEFLQQFDFHFHSEVIEFWLVGWLDSWIKCLKLKSDSLSCSCPDTHPHIRRA